MFEKFLKSPLELFRELISSYNHEVKKKGLSEEHLIPLGKTFKLRFALSNKTHERYLFLINQIEGINRMLFDQSINRQLRCYENKYNAEYLATLGQSRALGESIVNRMKVIQKLRQKNFDWYEAHNKLLNDDNNWKLWIAEAHEQQHDDLNLRVLRDQWKSHGRYSHYSTTALIITYQQYLPALLQFNKRLQKELEKKSFNLPSLIEAGYRKYLAENKANIEAEKQQIRHAMLARLQVGAEKKDISCVDVTTAMLTKLTAEGVKFEDSQKMPLMRGLAPANFAQMKKIIERDGDTEQRAQLRALPYFAKPAQPVIAIMQVKLGKNEIYIPEALIGALPKNPVYKKLPKIVRPVFRESRFKHRFLKHADCQYILAASNNLPTIKMDLTKKVGELTQNFGQSALQVFDNIEQVISSELNRQKETLIDRKKLFFGQALDYLDSYRDQLLIIANHLLAQRVKFIRDSVQLFLKMPTVIKNNEIYIELLNKQILKAHKLAEKYENKTSEEEIKRLSLRFIAFLEEIRMKSTVDKPVTAQDKVNQEAALELRQSSIKDAVNSKAKIEALKQVEATSPLNPVQAYTCVSFTTAKEKALDEFKMLSKTTPIEFGNERFKTEVNTFYTKGLLARENINSRHNEDEDVIKDEEAFRKSLYTFFERLLQKVVLFKNKKELKLNIDNLVFVEDKLLELSGNSLLQSNIKDMRAIRSSEFTWLEYKIICNSIIKSIQKYNSGYTSFSDAINKNNSIYLNKQMKPSVATQTQVDQASKMISVH